MPTDTWHAFLEDLKAGQFLSAAQAAELARGQSSLASAQALAEELVERRWLTAYQAGELLGGRVQDLLLGPYVLLDRLGQGGMGQVFKARHRLMNRVVAIKFIRPEHLADETALARFQREIQALSQVSHPNVVLAYHADQLGARTFLVMEYVEGATLDALVAQKGPLPWALASDFVRQAALGLQHAHERGLVHRDVKPNNLMLARPAGAGDADGGTVKILDLGLALIRPRTAAPGTSDTARLTSAHTVVGTPDFMAPEQAVNTQQADIRADIYSLGCTLYFLLTGRPPFPKGTALEKILLHQQAHPLSVQILRPDVPPALAAAVTTMLAKRPQERYQTPAEAASALAPFCRDRPITPRLGHDVGLAPALDTLTPVALTQKSQALLGTPRPPGSAGKAGRLFPVLLAVLVLALGAVGGVWLFSRLNQPDQGREDPKTKEDPRPGTPVELIVAPAGPGTLATIADALKAAPPRARIRVRPGVYQEALVIDREVEIVGEGDVGEVVIEVPDGNALLVSADSASVHNVTVRGKTGPKGGEFSTVKISHGRPVLEDCHIIGATGSGVVILGQTANPTLRRCVIADNTRAGIFVTRGAQATIEDCGIHDNQVGMHISEKGNPSLRNCTIEDNREFGVFLFQQGEGRIDEGCVVARNKIGVGIQEEGSHLILQNCSVQANLTSGVVIQKGGKGTFFECSLLDNNEFGVLLSDEGSNAAIQSCKVQRNATGIGVRDRAHGRIEDCDLRDNQAFPLVVNPGCDVVEKNNKK